MFLKFSLSKTRVLFIIQIIFKELNFGLRTANVFFGFGNFRKIGLTLVPRVLHCETPQEQHDAMQCTALEPQTVNIFSYL